MNTDSPKALAHWRMVFLTVEATVLTVFLFSWVAETFFDRYWVPGSQAVEWMLAGMMAAAWMFLLVASPFFFRSLRVLAVTGWLIAIGIFLVGILTPAP